MTDRKIKILGAVITSLVLFAASVTQIFINDSAGISVSADDTYETFSDGSAYMIKNVNSGMYIDVTGGKAENNTNIQQWGADGSKPYNTFKLYSAGNGYYSIVSCVGDGSSFALDVAEWGTADGTNICLYTYSGYSNQLFKFLKNDDGSYRIATKMTNEASGLTVAEASNGSGANIEQSALTEGDTSRDWILEPVEDPGCVMKTDVIYTFKNVNSGLVMDIKDDIMAEETNIQQWESNEFDCQKWQLVRLNETSRDYYILSCQDLGYGLYADWTNKSTAKYNVYLKKFLTQGTSDAGMLFRFSKNTDGSYRIIPHSSEYKRYVEVADASTSSGANVQHFQLQIIAVRNGMR